MCDICDRYAYIGDLREVIAQEIEAAKRPDPNYVEDNMINAGLQIAAHIARRDGEPVEGHPRIVQGRAREVDAAGNRILLQAVIPMWITLATDQSAREFHAGDIVNFYMESGVVFTPQA
jgi:hypothetical protein